jgi:hypothetical protein
MHLENHRLVGVASLHKSLEFAHRLGEGVVFVELAGTDQDDFGTRWRHGGAGCKPGRNRAGDGKPVPKPKVTNNPRAWHEVSLPCLFSFCDRHNSKVYRVSFS